MISEPIIPHKKGKTKKTTLFLILTLAFLGVCLLLLNSSYFKIKDVKITNSAECIDESNLRKTLNLTGKRIFNIDDEDIITIIKKNHCVKDASVVKSLPNKIEIKINQRIPAARIITHSNQIKKIDFDLIEATASSASAQTDLAFNISTSGASFLVDKNGILFAEDSQLNNVLNIHYANNDLKLGDSIGEGIIPGVLSVLEKFKVEGVKVDEIRLIGRDLLLTGDINVYFALDSDLSKQIVSLQLILKGSKIDSKKMERVDLRYNKPVVIYSPQKKN